MQYLSTRKIISLAWPTITTSTFLRNGNRRECFHSDERSCCTACVHQLEKGKAIAHAVSRNSHDDKCFFREIKRVFIIIKECNIDWRTWRRFLRSRELRSLKSTVLIQNRTSHGVLDPERESPVDGITFHFEYRAPKNTTFRLKQTKILIATHISKN